MAEELKVRYLKLLELCKQIIADDHKKKPWGIHYRWTKPKTWAAFKEEVGKLNE